jgi:hypothetical protein
MNLNNHAPISLHAIMLNWLRTGTNLTFYILHFIIYNFYTFKEIYEWKVGKEILRNLSWPNQDNVPEFS